METNVFLFEIVMNVFVASFRFAWIPMLWVYMEFYLKHISSTLTNSIKVLSTEVLQTILPHMLKLIFVILLVFIVIFWEEKEYVI